MRLIDADILPRHGNRGGLVYWKDVENAPTVDTEPTRHGRWYILNDDPHDESGMPKEKGYYKVIDEFGNEYTDLYYAEPRMTPRGIGYWQDSRYMIRAWARMDGEE